ncbi:sensor domain-containing diguanylate cyclase [bacterium]|nr:sensor domain-containing diguanylate cyclase [bacterium]
MERIEKLAKLLNESYSEKSLYGSLEVFFNENFTSNNFEIITDEKHFNDNNRPKFPLYKHKKCIGYLVFDSISEDLDSFLKVCSAFISLKLQNIMLSEKMQKNIDFHDTMKNIAKIIETQYELHYIIPIIGEMLDKFFADYLIYIFLRNENTGTCELSWPALCRDDKILKVVNNIHQSELSEDEKMYALPLVSESKNVGVLVAKSTAGEITLKDRDYLEQLSVQIATTINRANVYAEILKHATLDALTGFYNRHQLEERIKQEVANAKRQHAPLCGIMTDIDYFKSVNDTYGHAAGDLVLKTIAKVIRSQLREYDIAGRYGGEEFSILLPFTKITEAEMVAERLRQTVEDKIIDISKINPETDTKSLKITISLGIYEIKECDSDEDLMRKADKALYQAKNTGRNKVVINND